MKNLSSKLIFIILSLNIIVTGIVAIPPESEYLLPIDEKKAFNLGQKNARTTKDSQPAYPKLPLHFRVNFNREFDNGHFFLFLGAMILMAVSWLIERLKRKYKKTE